VNEQQIIYLCPSIASRSAFGMRCAFPPEINATRTRAVTKRSSARLHSCSKVTDAPLTSLRERNDVEHVVQDRRQQIRALDRITANFICASTEQPLPGDGWASLKPLRPVLYPDASQFRELPAADATLLVAFYDSLQGVTDTLDDYIARWPTTDVNAWNGLMHQARNSLALGEKAIRVFCAEKPFNEAAPASGTMLNQYQRVTSAMKKALDAHIARHEARAMNQSRRPRR
jgi:hypothetical protein